MIDFTEENNIPYVDIAAFVPKDDLYMEDFTHFTNAGSRMVAAAFAQAIFSLNGEEPGVIEPPNLCKASDR